MGLRDIVIALLVCGASGAAQNPPPSLTTIYNFTDSSGGYQPVAPVIVGQGGVLYGSTYKGGLYNDGTVFSLTPLSSPGRAWAQTVLYSFGGGTDGANPEMPLVLGPGGVLYGTTTAGGPSNLGTVFSLTPPASAGGAWTEEVLYAFSHNGRGATPGGLALGVTGEIYGVAAHGGAFNCGTVFVLEPPTSADQAWSQRVLYSFQGGTDASSPSPAVSIGKGSVFYGTTFAGGDLNQGAIFSLTPPVTPGGAWTEAVLYSFGGYPGDGSQPSHGVVIGADGVLFGTTEYGGSQTGGVVFSLAPPASPGGSWTETLLLQFPAFDRHPYPLPGPLTLGENGRLYGTTFYGDSAGTAYVLKPPATADGAWTEIQLCDFAASSNGLGPTGLAIGADGVLYGATNGGGAYNSGIVFALAE
ncbi:MAG: choice-of-anchor tandem repeat GloVer-containing protein [Bryobacteraceae bacterium]|jgi:uncharacterized repeat protein (TIGR03803 family)